MTEDSPVWIDEENGIIEDNLRKITIEYDLTKDGYYINKLEQLLNSYPRCDNCENFYIDGEYSSFRACCCKIHGCLEYIYNPHFNLDGAECPDYKRDENKILYYED